MFGSSNPREILNEALWRADADFGKVEVTYVHRGAPGDRRTVGGRDIEELERDFMVLRRVPGRPRRPHVPYHRVTRIRYGGETVYEREEG